MKLLLFLLLILAGASSSAIVESEGEGCSSDIKKAKREALRKAKLNAVERHVGVLISSKTLIVNSKLMRDVIQVRVAGFVKLAGSPVYGKPRIEGRDQICITARASFDIPDKSLKPADFGLVMVLSKKELKAGEELWIEISSEKPCYPYLFSVDAEGKVYRLLPNPVEGSSELLGKLHFPTHRMLSEGYRLVVAPLPKLPPPQREEILFLCAKERVKSFEDFFPSAFAEDDKELRKLLTTDYTRTVERFSEILTQLGAENYDMVDDSYVIY